MTMYQFLKPYGFINYKVIKGITIIRNQYYIIDVCGNLLLTNSESYSDLESRGYPHIETRMKGAW